jgi:peptidoglycan/LPS O-acetylase OafA/YrhL
MACWPVGGREMPNNFNLIRLVAAAAVIWSHSYSLAVGPQANDALYWFFGHEVGRVAVDVFFVVSGYLIAKSAARSPSLLQFVVNRLLRIYPGLWACLALTSVVYLLSSVHRAGVDPWHEVAIYVRTNALLIRGAIDFSMDGAFPTNPMGGVINGSLWTLPWELRMYALVAICYFFFRRASRVFVILTLGMALSVELLCHYKFLQAPPLVPLVSRFVSTFFLGVFFAEFFPAWRFHSKAVWGLLGCALVLALMGRGLPYVVYLLCLPMVVLGLALSVSSPERLRQLTSTDVSYGVYLYGFPIQQAVAAMVPGVSPTVMTMVSLPLALSMGWASYKLVEAPALTYRTRLLLGLKRLPMIGGRA